MAALSRHSWPGNVRELENVIERALVLGSGTTLDVGDLPASLQVPSEVKPENGMAGKRLADVERDHIVSTLRAVEGNKAAAARVLGLNRKTLYRKLTQHHIGSCDAAASRGRG
jgi:DNA-binding NtrC family response regulator